MHDADCRAPDRGAGPVDITVTNTGRPPLLVRVHGDTVSIALKEEAVRVHVSPDAVAVLAGPRRRPRPA
jgi:hypothetical protein